MHIEVCQSYRPVRPRLSLCLRDSMNIGSGCHSANRDNCPLYRPQKLQITSNPSLVERDFGKHPAKRA